MPADGQPTDPDEDARSVISRVRLIAAGTAPSLTVSLLAGVENLMTGIRWVEERRAVSAAALITGAGPSGRVRVRGHRSWAARVGR